VSTNFTSHENTEDVFPDISVHVLLPCQLQHPGVHSGSCTGCTTWDPYTTPSTQ